MRWPPVAMLIGLGYALRASGFMPEASWTPIDRLVYFVLFPALLVSELAAADLAGLPVARMAAVLLATQLVMARRWPAAPDGRWRLDGPAYTSVLQCVVRWNTYVALALAPALFGADAMPLVALAVAVMVPAANVMSVAALARHGSAGRAGPAAFARARRDQPADPRLPRSASRSTCPGSTCHRLAAEPLAILGRATLALGLLTVGAGLRPADWWPIGRCRLRHHGRAPAASPGDRRGPGAARRADRYAARGGGAGLRRADGDLLLHPGPAAGRRRRADGGPGDHDHGRRAATLPLVHGGSAGPWAELPTAAGRAAGGSAAPAGPPCRPAASTPLARIMLA